MSFSSRRRNYLLTPHRRDGLIEWMKSMLTHSFVLDALETTAPDTFTHFEILIEEHRKNDDPQRPSRLKQLVPTVGMFHTPLPLRKAFLAYNSKYRLTARRHVQVSFNELRHILNLAQIMAFRGITSEISCSGDDGDDDDDDDVLNWSGRDSPSALFTMEKCFSNTPANSEAGIGPAPPPLLSLDGNDAAMKEDESFKGPQMITFDGDQTLYKDGANFESNPKLANYLYLLLRKGVTVAVVTAAGYEYQSEKYELRLSGLLAFFKEKELPPDDCARFYLFGGECNYLLHLGADYRLHAVKERGPGGWLTATRYISDSPANWDASDISCLLDIAEETMRHCLTIQNMRGRIIRKNRAVGLIPMNEEQISREALDETVLCVQQALGSCEQLPFCSFNGGRDAWVDVGNKRVGVQILQSYLGIRPDKTLHIGDQFLNTGNDYAARDICPCVWITDPEETTYILKSILRLAGVSLLVKTADDDDDVEKDGKVKKSVDAKRVNFSDVLNRKTAVQLMDVYTGEIKQL